VPVIVIACPFGMFSQSQSGLHDGDCEHEHEDGAEVRRGGGRQDRPPCCEKASHVLQDPNPGA
jgi:hypothetical protein